MLNVLSVNAEYSRTFSTSDIALARLVVMLRAYLDDSGKAGDPYETSVVVAGAIADVNKWDSLDEEWKAVLRRYGVAELHMKDFSHCQGEFKGWDEYKRRTFLKKLCPIVDKWILKPIGAMVPLEQFKILPKKKKSEWLNDPYFACLQDTIELTTIVAKELFDPPEHIHIICDEQPKFEAKANSVYRACKKYLENGDRLISFGHASSKNVPGLQVADLVAYEALKIRRDMENPSKNVIDDMRWPMTQLLKKHAEFEFYTAQKLKQRTALPFNYTP